MHVKGNAWLARSEYLKESLGEQRWRDFLAVQAKAVSFLRAPVMPITRLDVAEFLAVNDAIVREFYAGDALVYWRFGAQSAEWALRNQLRALFSPKEGRRFLLFSPTLFKSYYDGGELVAEANGEDIDLLLRDVEPRHLYFEFNIMGFAVGGLRALEVPTEPLCVRGYSKGDAEVCYRFSVRT